MRKLMKAKGNTGTLLEIMFSDLQQATSAMKGNPNDQFLRRTCIRTLAATLDGIIFCFKETTFAMGALSGYKFTTDEMGFLTETMQTPGKRPRFLPFRDNLKETFKFFAKIHNAACSVNFQHDGFAALCETYELRNRVVHPKSIMTFYVSDKEKSRAGEAIKWLDTEIKKLFDVCSSQYKQSNS